MGRHALLEGDDKVLHDIEIHTAAEDATFKDYLTRLAMNPSAIGLFEAEQAADRGMIDYDLTIDQWRQVTRLAIQTVAEDTYGQ